MLSALIARRRWRRYAGVCGAAILLVLAFVSAMPTPAEEIEPARTLASRLSPETWAFAVPMAWFVTPVPAVLAGDRIDVLGIRGGERASASAIAADLEVISVDERVLIVAVDAAGATQLALARASGLLLVPLLRAP